MPHGERGRWCEEISKINTKVMDNLGGRGNPPGAPVSRSLESLKKSGL